MYKITVQLRHSAKPEASFLLKKKKKTCLALSWKIGPKTMSEDAIFLLENVILENRSDKQRNWSSQRVDKGQAVLLNWPQSRVMDSLIP